ncbi:g_PROTEIN_RECEP_F1_2 domain-containing protein [Caerostris extrusa]|uniref:G_PROTEIN_RECEP_F1_2 domain-containing protein n=1 Tax=Caerostris extrusa TaxID=172846 RepID=A0AAV4M9F5_CAEEX|nr:g_PROTEIN_RECEP_F1_2 domain-containing protein [Caerostris extrusa]
MACVGQFGTREYLTPWVSVVPSIFAKMSTLYNPAIYGLSHRHFKSTISRLLNSNRRNRSGTVLSRNNSNLIRSRVNCSCLPMHVALDAVADNSSSSVGNKIYASSQDSRRVKYIRGNNDREDVVNLGICGNQQVASSQEEQVQKYVEIHAEDSPTCSHHIPASYRSCSYLPESAVKSMGCGQAFRKPNYKDVSKLRASDNLLERKITGDRELS